MEARLRSARAPAIALRHAALDGPPPSDVEREWLDEVEQQRARRFHFERDRARFVAAHVFLRRELARELGVAPRALRFELGPHGKPRVVDSDRAFSLTHTAWHAFLAIGPIEMGLDAEAVVAASVDAALAERVMTAEELRPWLQAGPDARVDTFFRLWSAKESVMKASGLGMKLGPRSFAVLNDRLEVVAQTQALGRLWTLEPIPADDELRLCLAFEAR